MVRVCVAGKTVWPPCYRAISESFRDEVHDEALYKSRFLCAMHVFEVWASSSTPVPNFVSVATSVAELAHRENRVLNQSLNHSVSHPAYLMPREPKLWNKQQITAASSRSSFSASIETCVITRASSARHLVRSSSPVIISSVTGNLSVGMWVQRRSMIGFAPVRNHRAKSTSFCTALHMSPLAPSGRWTDTRRPTLANLIAYFTYKRAHTHTAWQHGRGCSQARGGNCVLLDFAK